MVSGYRICDPMAVGHDFHQSSSCSLQGIVFFTLEDRNRDSFTDTIIGLYVLSYKKIWAKQCSMEGQKISDSLFDHDPSIGRESNFHKMVLMFCFFSRLPQNRKGPGKSDCAFSWAFSKQRAWLCLKISEIENRIDSYFSLLS